MTRITLDEYKEVKEKNKQLKKIILEILEDYWEDIQQKEDDEIVYDKIKYYKKQIEEL
jgi:hypothetical protein